MPGGCGCGAGWSETVSDAEVVEVFERVRDIPFSFAPHTDAEMLLRHGSGTCERKEAVLGIHHRTALPRDVLARVNAWLDDVREHSTMKEMHHG